MKTGERAKMDIKNMHTNKLPVFIFSLFAFFTTPTVYAEGFTNLRIIIFSGKETCSLEEYRLDIPEESRKLYPGDRSLGICVVDIPSEKFDKEYEFCSMSGLQTMNVGDTEGISCSVKYYKDYWRFIAIIDNVYVSNNRGRLGRGVGCSFICKNN